MSTTKDRPPETQADAAIEPASVRKPEPELAVPRASTGSDLESRIKVRRAELVGKLGELRAEASLQAIEAGDRLKARLSEIAHIVREGVVDGWTSLSDTVTHKLERWLSESERSLSTLPVRSGRS